MGSTVITLRATDQDIGKNSDIEYGIEGVTGECNPSPTCDLKITEHFPFIKANLSHYL